MSMGYIQRRDGRRYPGYFFRLKVVQPTFDSYLAHCKDSIDIVEGVYKKSSRVDVGTNLLYPEIEGKCHRLFTEGHYAEAVEKSFKVVKDRLRELTGFESGSDAFGKGKLHIKGAAASNVDGDFNKATQYLMMAVDMYRNEKSHTSDAKIDDPIRAYQYLVLSSLAMFLLEDSEILR